MTAIGRIGLELVTDIGTAITVGPDQTDRATWESTRTRTGPGSTSSSGYRGHVMRASELLGAAVPGPSGQDLGRVVDVRLVQDGPLLGAFAAMRIDGLVVGQRRLASRLGDDRQEASGPAGLRAAVRWWTRDNRYLP